jgi:hypothetical protein
MKRKAKHSAQAKRKTQRLLLLLELYMLATHLHRVDNALDDAGCAHSVLRIVVIVRNLRQPTAAGAEDLAVAR